MTRGRAIAFRIAVPILVFIMGEWTVRHLFDVRSRIGIAERQTLAAYQDVPWARQYFRDLLSCVSQSADANHPRYARYVLQDINEDCTTETVNYGNRLRKTWNPDDARFASARRVYDIAMFGGSTMEGQGTIDDETIPSHFSKLANASAGDVAYRVTNFGVGGYTFTQDIIKLMVLLRDGHRFDSVIFYDGANDIDYAYEVGEPGGLAGEEDARVKLEGTTWSRLRESAKEQVNSCVLCLAGLIFVRETPLLQDYVAPYLVRIRDTVQFKRGQKSADDGRAFGQDVAQYDGQSHDLLTHIANAYGFTYLTAWQPSLMYDAEYGPGEDALARMDPRLTDTGLRARYDHTRKVVRSLNLPQFVDLSGALDGRTKACYVDAVHMSGECNGMVARRLFEAWTASTQPASSSAAALE